MKIRRSTAHSTKQGGGERSQVSALGGRKSTTDHDSGPTGQREAAPAQALAGVRSKQRHAEDVPVSSIYGLGVGRVALGAASIGGESTHELFRVTIATAAARGARNGSRPAITAAFPPHCVASKQESAAMPQQARLQRAQFRSKGVRQDELPNGRGNDPTSHVVRWVKSHSSVHTKPARKERNYVAAAASSKMSRKTQAAHHSPTDDARARTAKAAHASTGRGWAADASSNNCATAARQEPSKKPKPGQGWAADVSSDNCATTARQEPSKGVYTAEATRSSCATAAEQAAPGTVLQARGEDRRAPCCATAIRTQSSQENGPPPVNL